MTENMTAEIFASVDYVVMVMSSPLQDRKILEETMMFDNDDPEDTHNEAFEEELSTPRTRNVLKSLETGNLFEIFHYSAQIEDSK